MSQKYDSFGMPDNKKDLFWLGVAFGICLATGVVAMICFLAVLWLGVT